MLLFISILGIFLSVVLLYFNARRYTSSIYLSIFCFLISLYSANQYIILYSKSEFWISLVYTNITFLSYLIGPMCYWYTRTVLSDDVRLKKWDIVHFIPMLIHFSVSLPYILTPFSFKAGIAKSIISDPDFLGVYHATILSDLLSNSFIYLSRPFLILLYVFGSIGLVIKNQTKKEKVLVESRQRFLYKWLMFFLGFLLLYITSHLLLVFRVFESDGEDLFLNLSILNGFANLSLLGLIITPFFFPQILYGLPNFNASVLTVPPEPEGNEGELILPLDLKKKVPNFEFQYMVTIIHKMATCMQEQQPYLQPDFNLGQFSVLIQIPTHHLAYFFREVKMQSFNDYRNECRIFHAKKLILQGKADEYTLEAIATLSGFTNRNTFFIAFKKVEGISPSAFVALLNP